jgi:hypothetical protein
LVASLASRAGSLAAVVVFAALLALIAYGTRASDNARHDIDLDQWCRFSPMLPFSSREGVWRLGVGDNFAKPLLEKHRTCP